MHSLVRTCRVREYPHSKFGPDNNDDDYELWFRNKHHTCGYGVVCATALRHGMIACHNSRVLPATQKESVCC